MIREPRVIIITGAGHGIGAVTAHALAAAGNRVVIAEIDGPAGDAVADAIMAAGHEALAVQTDVTDEPAVGRMVAAALGRFGQIDALVNNHVFVELTPWDQLTLDLWNRHLVTNVVGSYFTARAVVPAMRQQGKGHILNIASGHVFRPGPDVVAYAASKAGIVGLTRALARELGIYNITVNCIAPGLTRTDHAASVHDDAYFDAQARERFIKRWEYPEDLVGAIDFFTSDAASFITGQLLSVDGGKNLH